MSAIVPDHNGSVDSPNASASNLKRKRSPSISSDTLLIATASKATKPAPNSFSINYLARSTSDDLPLIKKDETTSHLLFLLSQYSNVLDRQESLASNLGARPLGPILIKRFERCFDDPPKVIASHNSKHSTTEDTSQHITWLEVIEFARAHPAQFNLSTFSEGRRVCQFYYPQKQLRVQVSEEDFIFIKSGRCQELIPPLPIWEDEEKEVSTCEVLESRLKEVTNVADMIAARTRQLTHRIKNRKAAILERRAEGGSGTPARANTQQTTLSTASDGRIEEQTSTDLLASKRDELLKHFESLPQNQLQLSNDETITPHTRHRSSGTRSVSPVLANTSSSLDARQPKYTQSSSAQRKSSTTTVSSKHNFSKPLALGLEVTQPFRPLCQAHMDSLPRGHRVLPPCDRCRRLRMDCVKNLTSCAGCTKKHARCHWRDVTRDELSAIDHTMESSHQSHTMSKHAVNDHSVHEGDSVHTETDDDSIDGLEDSRRDLQLYPTRATVTENSSGTEATNDVTTAIRDAGSSAPLNGLRSVVRETDPERQHATSSSHTSAEREAERAHDRDEETAPTSIGGFRAVNNIFPGTEVHGSI